MRAPQVKPLPSPRRSMTKPALARWRHARDWPLRLKFTLILLLAALLPALLVSALNLRSSRAQALAVERSDLAADARALARRIDQMIDARRKTVEILAQERELVAYLRQPTARRQALQAALDQQLLATLRTHVNLSAVSLADSAGIVVASSEDGQRGRDASARDDVRQALATGRTQVSGLTWDDSDHGHGIDFAAPVRSPDGEILGAAVLRVRSDLLDGVLAEVEPPLTPFVVDRAGLVIAHADAALRWRSVGAVDAARSAQLRQDNHLSESGAQPLGFHGLPPSAASAAGSLDLRAPDGAPWVAGQASAHGSVWRIYVGAPSARLAQPLRELALQALLSLAVVLALVLPAAGWLGRAMSRPMRALSQAARRLRQGVADAGRPDPALAAASLRRDEIGQLGRSFQSMADEVRRREQHLDEQVRERTLQLQQSHARVDEELRIARAMQQDILPRSFPAGRGFSLHGHMQPALEMGGDFYDCFVLPDGRCGMLVADVSGKGVPAAFFMAVSSTIVQEVARQRVNPAQVLTRANELLCRRNPMELFVTLVYALYDPADGALTYACAGHDAPLMRDAAGSVRALPATPELPLGAMPGTVYEEQRVTLEHGALLLLYTDGVTDARSVRGETFGDQRLRQWLGAPVDTAPAGASVALMQHLENFIGEVAPVDDVTLLFFRRHAAAAAAPRPPWQARWCIESRLGAIAPLAGQIERALGEADLGLAPAALQKLMFEINLCIDEVLTNTIEHGLHGDASRRLDVELVFDGRTLITTLSDDAPPYDPFTEAPAPDIAADVESRPVGGLGLHLVKSFMDECSASHDGHRNRIVLRKHTGGGADPESDSNPCDGAPP